MSFTKKVISVTLKLGAGSLAGSPGSNAVNLDGLRVSARISKVGSKMPAHLELKIYGLSLSLMNQFSTLGTQITDLASNVPRDIIKVSAGEEGSTLGLVFDGTIQQAYVDMEGAPKTCLTITANSGLVQAVAPAPPSSYQGTGDVATIMQSLATAMNLAFTNYGVTTKLSNPYFYGSYYNQAKACVEHALCEWNNCSDGEVVIWPRNGHRGTEVPLVSPDTGLVNYPAYTASGLLLTCQYNPSINIGGLVNVKSSLNVQKGPNNAQFLPDRSNSVNGTWYVNALDHVLEANVFNGQWFSILQVINPKYEGQTLPNTAPQ